MSRKTLPKIRSLGEAKSSGVYGWELGSIAFSDPLERIGKKAAQREKAVLKWKEQGQKRKEKRSSKADFHKKHG